MNIEETVVAPQGEVAAPAKKVSTPKKAAPAKKAAAKKAPAKKKAAPAKKEVVVKEELKAPNLADAVKAIKKGDQKLGVVSVNGKKYSFTKRKSWAISKNLIKQGVAGIIMVVEDEGHFIYPAADYKELFSKIFASETYKNTGNYSQSTLPQWHEAYFTEAK